MNVKERLKCELLGAAASQVKLPFRTPDTQFEQVGLPPAFNSSGWLLM
jgi:hypothetical protein